MHHSNPLLAPIPRENQKEAARQLVEVLSDCAQRDDQL